MRLIHSLINLCIILLIIFILGTGWSWANENKIASNKSHHLGINFNSGLASYREDLVVPLGFHGLALSLGAIYSRQTEKNLLYARLRIGLGYLKNRYDHEALILIPEIRFSWLRKFAATPRLGEFSGGICIPLQVNDLYWGSWDDAHLYWLTAHSLGVSFQWQKKISTKNLALVRMEIPVINLVSRPPMYRYTKQEPINHLSYFFTEPNRSLHFETIDTYRALFVQILLSRQIKRSLLNLGIEFQYNYFSQPKEIWGLNTSIVLSYQWRIGS